MVFPFTNCGLQRQQRKGDDGFVFRTNLFKQLSFELMRDGHFAGGDLLWGGADEAKLAMAEAFGAVFAHRLNGRPEDATGHGTPRIDVAAARGRVERRTCGIVGEVFKAGLIGV